MAKTTKTEEKVTQKNELPEERVTVFGDKWDEKKGKSCRHNDGLLCGSVFIAAGVLLFLNTLYIIPWKVWDFVWRFWPLLLIVWGIQIFLGSGAVSRFLVAVLEFVLVVLVALFAVYQVSPSLLTGMPTFLFQIFAIMKGTQP